MSHYHGEPQVLAGFDARRVSRRVALRTVSASAAGLALASPRVVAVTFAAFTFDETGHFSTISQVRVQSILDEEWSSLRGLQE